MAIGEQFFDGVRVSSTDLRARYNDLIREAILRARPGLEVMRADEVSVPGVITTDIITRIMHADLVVADVTYPNANVFYELGLRHACKIGTIIIRDRSGPRTPFDIAGLRCIEYDNTPSGLKSLAGDFCSYLEHLERDPSRPDNQFQELAKLTSYTFPNYRKEDAISPETQAMMGLMDSPEVIEMLIRKKNGEEIDQGMLIRAVLSNPKVAQPLLESMVKAGQLSFLPKEGLKRRGNIPMPKRKR
ncbi:MAG: hypothetical protein IPO08_00085 [Xanthomonadales bacterium]|jgi:hypothetical protein|nr:hypothetical protein [Xanthomonadales bacterium]